MMDLRNLFERLATVPKVRSINGVFIAIDKTLEDTNFEPEYQRNYVWDDEKATYFIETIFLGSEVPPIILFKSPREDGFIQYEVIDGRQRYQTITRFLNGDLKLKKSGLQKLGEIDGFAGKTFKELPVKYQNLFKDTKIRTIEYSFIGPYSKEEEDAVKREIFQRYNSGITPLKGFELDKAKYHYNDLNQGIKDTLEDNKTLNSQATSVFMWEKLNIDQKVAKIRELLVLHRIPIKYYANKKQAIISKYFEYVSSQLEDDREDILDSFQEKIVILYNLRKRIVASGISYNRLYAECLFWAFSVMDQNQVRYDLTNEVVISSLMEYLSNHISEFTSVRSSFYNVLVGRYECMAKFFEDEYCCSFRFAIENNDYFKQTNRCLPNSISPSENTIEANSFEQLRINKPEPISVELTELLSNLKSSCFILRPSYQRGDVKNKKKSSAIIESMLLGVMLPPIFVFKRNNGISEVIDGQQRLLSIISFIGESYKDENGNDQTPLLHNFKLELGESAVLKDLRGKAYRDLSKLEQNKIRKTSIFIIEIREDQNPNFDPVDLFVRLNNKPYPISSDSFEMWNSFAPREIIQLIKDATKANEKWFYFRKNNSRMDNENIFATLAYFQYMYNRNGTKDGDCAPESTIETYYVDNRVACRFRSRYDITHLLYNEINGDFVYATNQIEFDFVCNLRAVLADYKTNPELNKAFESLILVENGKRTQMSFYILWILLHDMSSEVLKQNHLVAFEQIKTICGMTNSCKDVAVFYDAVREFRSKYGSASRPVCVPVSGVAMVIDGFNEICNVQCVKFSKKVRVDNRFEAQSVDGIQSDDNAIFLQVNRAGFLQRYVEAFLRSKLFWYYYNLNNKRILSAIDDKGAMPFVSEYIQEQFVKILDYVDASISSSHSYFERLLDVMFYELIFQYEFDESGVKVIEVVKSIPSLKNLSENERFEKSKEVYNDLIDTRHLLGMYLLKVIDIDSVKMIENIAYEKDSGDFN